MGKHVSIATGRNEYNWLRGMSGKQILASSFKLATPETEHPKSNAQAGDLGE